MCKNKYNSKFCKNKYNNSLRKDKYKKRTIIKKNIKNNRWKNNQT